MQGGFRKKMSIWNVRLIYGWLLGLDLRVLNLKLNTNLKRFIQLCSLLSFFISASAVFKSRGLFMVSILLVLALLKMYHSCLVLLNIYSLTLQCRYIMRHFFHSPRQLHYSWPYTYPHALFLPLTFDFYLPQALCKFPSLCNLCSSFSFSTHILFVLPVLLSL